MIEKAKFTNYTLGKDLEKQTKKQVDALKSLNLPNKIDELKEIESIFQQNQLNGLIIDKLKEIKELNESKSDNLEYMTKRGNIFVFQ